MANYMDIQDQKVGVGDIVKLHLKITEGDKERIQIFEGMVIGIRGRQENKSFTVRKIAAAGVGVEKILPLNSPWLSKIEIKKKGSVRRAKLNYVRTQSAKQVSKITKSA